VSFRIAGHYLEVCNCEAICPCRRIDGAMGGRSTYGECLGVLSWMIEEGHAGAVSLAGLKVAFATRYHDDEPGSPWSFFLYVDGHGDERQRRALDSTVLDDAVTRLVGRGAQFIEFGEHPGHRWAVMRDPEGNEFCLQ